MLLAINYRVNTASAQEVAEHLLCCDIFFAPPLSQRVRIPDYAQKLVSQTLRFEAWSNNLLVGLVAAYCNNQEARVAYITSVSVVKDWAGNGIAQCLMQQCIKHANTINMRKIQLEVDRENRLARNLYTKIGFSADRADGQCILMTMNLKGENT